MNGRTARWRRTGGTLTVTIYDCNGQRESAAGCCCDHLSEDDYIAHLRLAERMAADDGIDPWDVVEEHDERMGQWEHE